jgi:Flp pilus assembly protein TadD
MSLRRFLVIVAALGCLEAVVFVWRYSDLVYFERPAAVLAQDASSRFVSEANRAMRRPALTRGKLETIATTAQARGDGGVAIRALSRLAREYPADAGVHLRLADGLRSAGRLEEAGRAYRQVLALTGPAIDEP